MCGIYGILDFNGREPCIESVARMADVTVHRGPDDGGVHADGPLRMGMRRLSIIDLEGGHQPIGNEDRTIWVVCNGEIYNFLTLRKKLEAKGHRFRTNSDTEVIVHLYEEYGDDLARHLDGMFAFAVWDSRKKQLLLGRDRLGIKPLYVFRHLHRLYFASELKAILSAIGSTPAMDQIALREYLSLGYVPAPLTIFEGVEKLNAGSLLKSEACAGSVTVSRYWHPATAEKYHPDDWFDALRTQLQKSVAAQMISDVPLGAFLSGGIDSSAVVAMMAQNSSVPVRTYAIGFEEKGAGALYNELDYARKVSRLFDTDHHEIVVQPDVASLTPKLLWHLDEPVADSAFITTHLVSELARQDVKVILSGVGGDELFGGYRRYLGSHYDRWIRMVPDSVMRNVLTPLARRLPSDRHSSILNYMRLAKAFVLSQSLGEKARYREYVGVFSEDAFSDLLVHESSTHRDTLQEAFDSLASEDAVERLMEVDLLTQMPDDLLALTDRMTMASSIECRVPLLDQDLVDLALSMPSSLKVHNGDLKHVLKKALSSDLPDEILFRRKRGFGAPMGAWLKESLSGMIDGLLSTEVLELRGLFKPDAVESLIQSHRANREDHSDHLQALANLEIFSRIFVDGVSPDDVGEELQEYCRS